MYARVSAKIEGEAGISVSDRVLTASWASFLQELMASNGGLI